MRWRASPTALLRRVLARIAPDALAIVKRAAEIQGRSVSDFVVAAAQEAAQRTIERTEIIPLSLEGQRAFAEATGAVAADRGGVVDDDRGRGGGADLGGGPVALDRLAQILWWFDLGRHRSAAEKQSDKTSPDRILRRLERNPSCIVSEKKPPDSAFRPKGGSRSGRYRRATVIRAIEIAEPAQHLIENIFNLLILALIQQLRERDGTGSSMADFAAASIASAISSGMISGGYELASGGTAASANSGGTDLGAVFSGGGLMQLNALLSQASLGFGSSPNAASWMAPPSAGAAGTAGAAQIFSLTLLGQYAANFSAVTEVHDGGIITGPTTAGAIIEPPTSMTVAHSGAPS